MDFNEKRQEALKLRKEAQFYCHSVKLDSAIRFLCSERGEECGRGIKRMAIKHMAIELDGGKCLRLIAGWGKINFAGAFYDKKENEKPDLTFFEGNPPILYYCGDGDYRFLYSFRKGRWVDTVLELAKPEEIDKKVGRDAARLRELEEELLRWTPLDE